MRQNKKELHAAKMQKKHARNRALKAECVKLRKEYGELLGVELKPTNRACRTLNEGLKRAVTEETTKLNDRRGKYMTEFKALSTEDDQSKLDTELAGLPLLKQVNHLQHKVMCLNDDRRRQAQA